MFEQSLFVFYITKKTTQGIGLPRICEFGEYTIEFSQNTPIIYEKIGERELLIIGYATDILKNESTSLAKSMLESTTNLKEILDFEWHIGGKYLILYKEASNIFAIPDATASISFCYTVDGALVCSPNSETIAQKLSLDRKSVV